MYSMVIVQWLVTQNGKPTNFDLIPTVAFKFFSADFAPEEKQRKVLYLKRSGIKRISLTHVSRDKTFFKPSHSLF